MLMLSEDQGLDSLQVALDGCRAQLPVQGCLLWRRHWGRARHGMECGFLRVRRHLLKSARVRRPLVRPDGVD